MTENFNNTNHVETKWKDGYLVLKEESHKEIGRKLLLFLDIENTTPNWVFSKKANDQPSNILDTFFRKKAPPAADPVIMNEIKTYNKFFCDELKKIEHIYNCDVDIVFVSYAEINKAHQFENELTGTGLEDMVVKINNPYLGPRSDCRDESEDEALPYVNASMIKSNTKAETVKTITQDYINNKDIELIGVVVAGDSDPDYDAIRALKKHFGDFELGKLGIIIGEKDNAFAHKDGVDFCAPSLIAMSAIMRGVYEERTCANGTTYRPLTDGYSVKKL